MPLPQGVFRVGISGSYGGLNLGDEAILHSIVGQLRASGPFEIVVFSRDAKDTMTRHKVERAVAVRDLSRDEVVPEVAHDSPLYYRKLGTKVFEFHRRSLGPTPSP